MIKKIPAFLYSRAVSVNLSTSVHWQMPNSLWSSIYNPGGKTVSGFPFYPCRLGPVDEDHYSKEVEGKIKKTVYPKT